MAVLLMMSLAMPWHMLPWHMLYTDDSASMQVYTSDSNLHSASVNSVAFAPHELGLRVAAASSDGSASVLTYNSTEGKWDQQKVTKSLMKTSNVAQ